MTYHRVRAAGGVVYRETDKGPEVVVVHRPRYDDWSLPKGKLDAGETALQGALREVEEETSLRCEASEELPDIEYQDHKGRPKTVSYWLMKPLDSTVGTWADQGEVDTVVWEPIVDALSRLTYPLDRSVLRSAAERLGVPIVTSISVESHLAAVDLGSNSFRLVISRSGAGELELIDRLREGVRLAASLDSDGVLSQEGQDRAIFALSRFGQRLKGLSADRVRAVGTNTLRKARNGSGFLEKAEQALGYPIEVVSGREEARLIYSGVSQSVSPTEGRRLVVDIGGGSTEIVVGEGDHPLHTESLFMGCVGWSLDYFEDGRIDRRRFRKALMAANLEMQPVVKRFRRLGWNECYGSSGTIKAIETLLVTNGWSSSGITLKGLKRLRRELLKHSGVKDLEIPELSKDRARVLPGGLAILLAVFDGLQIDVMHWSPGALREGLLHDLVGRIGQRDVRDETISRFVQRYGVDLEQATRVEETACSMLAKAGKSWRLEEPRARMFLSWAAHLHEIGLAVAHSGYHRHGAYLVENSDMPGFSRQDQVLLAILIRGHRRKLRPTVFEQLSEASRVEALRWCLLFRLAVLLNRSHSLNPIPDHELVIEGPKLGLSLPKGWLKERPLTREDLQQEARLLKPVGVSLSFS